MSEHILFKFLNTCSNAATAWYIFVGGMSIRQAESRSVEDV